MTASPDDRPERLLRGYGGRMALLLFAAFLAMQLGRRLLPPLLPLLIEDFGITPFAAGVAVSTLAVARAAGQYPSGRFADDLSRKTVIVTSMAACVVGLGLVVLAPTFAALLVGVAVFGASFGVYDPADRALLSDLFEEKRGRAFGLHFVGSDLAGVVAAGTAVVAVSAWRVAFLPSLLLLLPVVVLFYRWNREPMRVGWVDLEVRETLARLLGTARLRWILAAYVLFIFVASGVTSFLPTFLIEVHGASFAVASGVFAAMYVVGVVMRPLSGWLADRFPRQLVAGGSLLVAGAGLAGLVVAPSPAVALGAVVTYAVGLRSYSPPMQAHLMDVFDDESRGGDLGATRTVYMGLGSVGPAYVGFVAGRAGYVVAYAGAAAALLVAAGISYRLARIE
ncbi:MAG: MFS transporter [Haloferacaceae archaeon]